MRTRSAATETLLATTVRAFFDSISLSPRLRAIEWDEFATPTCLFPRTYTVARLGNHRSRSLDHSQQRLPPVTLTFELDLDSVKFTQRVKYTSQKLISSKLLSRHAHHRHT